MPAGARRPRWRRIATPAALLAGAAVIGLALHNSSGQMDNGQTSITRELPQPMSGSKIVVSLPPPNLLRPLSPEEAAKENADRPFVDRPDSPASRFVLRTDKEDSERALTCLTQAVYYEAASEGADGGRAVAQVVLNRMRHPGYPASVCGVVYQGAGRVTGCQFTFTCDGSLLRTPVASLWARSREIAKEALAGRVFAAVGHATHYHADYVIPYWADSLDKSVQIGRHIFYRFRSSLGDSRAFFQRYAGTEPLLPAPDAAVVIPAEAITPELASALISDSSAKATPDVEKASLAPSERPLIDSVHGTLLADGDKVPASIRRPKSAADCPADDRRRLTPLGANEIRAGSNASTC